MKKLQKLITKYHDKLWDWLEAELIIDKKAWERHETILIDWFVDGEPMLWFTLADLIFWESWFMECVEWTFEPDNEEIFISDWGRYLEWKEFHLMRLAILSEKERVEYIETNSK